MIFEQVKFPSSPAENSEDIFSYWMSYDVTSNPTKRQNLMMSYFRQKYRNSFETWQTVLPWYRNDLYELLRVFIVKIVIYSNVATCRRCVSMTSLLPPYDVLQTILSQKLCRAKLERIILLLEKFQVHIKCRSAMFENVKKRHSTSKFIRTSHW